MTVRKKDKLLEAGTPTPVEQGEFAKATDSHIKINAKGGAHFPSIDIPPTPSHILHIPLERAQMLATFPRGKWSDPVWAAVCGFLGSAPAALHAIYEGFLRPDATGLDLSPANSSRFG